MSDIQKITSSHLTRVAVVYLRQSSAAQVEHNRESTDRQYALVHKADELGWPTDRVVVIDEDLGLTGSGAVARSGFARLTAEVALGHVGLVLGLEVSRLARNNADWYRLIDLCGLSNTLIGDADGLYHPALFNDRLLLGLKGTMSEAELYILRARLNGGIRNKAARGELRRGLPVGFVWGEADGEVRFHPDEGVRTTIASVFTRFAETGSARRVWLWFRLHGLRLPLRMHQGWEIRWVEASYTAIHQVLSNPVYAGAYAYGKTRQEVTLDASGRRKKRMRHLPQSEWQVKTHYSGRNTTPGYHCAGKIIVEGRGCYCLNVGGVQIDEAIAKTFLAALEPAKLAATIAAAERLEADSEAALKQWRLGVERASYEASRAERRYMAVDPDNRLVARGLERDWEQRLADLEAAKDELARRLEQRPHVLGQEERERLLALGADLATVWDAPTTAPRDRKELLRALIEEVILSVDRDKSVAHLTLRWKGGALIDLDVPLPRSRPATVRTDEGTLDLVRRLAALYPDTVIAGILNRQGRTTARGYRFEANRVATLRTHWRIPCFQPKPEVAEGEIMTVAATAAALNVAPSTLHRWLNDGLIPGEQVTPGRPGASA